MSKRDQDREVSRRALIKWSLAAGAALGVARSTCSSILERTAGKRVAEAAARDAEQALGPHSRRQRRARVVPADVAAQRCRRRAQHDVRVAVPRRGQTTMIAGTDEAADDRSADRVRARTPRAKQITALMAGTNEQHTDNPNSIARSVSSRLAVRDRLGAAGRYRRAWFR